VGVVCRLVSVLLAAALVSSGWILASVWPLRGDAGAVATSSTPDPNDVLAVVSSSNGTLRLRGASGTLTLTGASERPVWFSNRPQRSAGTYSIAEFRDAFFGQQDPPNAALDVAGADPARNVVILELSEPEYTSSGRRLRFDVQVIDPTRQLGPSSQLRWQAARADARVARKFGPSALFVDSAAGDDTTPCLVTLQDGYIVDLEGIDCLDAETLVDMTDIPTNCANSQYFTVPNFGVWQCSGTASTAVIWLSPVTNDKFPDSRFTMYPCSQNPPACQTS
jgi:hypothetical protein